MKKFKLIFSFIILSFIFSTTSYAAHANFTASLTGEQEAPAVITSAKGTGTFTLTGAGGLRYAITVSGLSGPITGAHFHLGGLKIAGPVLYDITSSFAGTSATGTLAAPLPDSVIAALMTGRIYVNVHTAANPGGEIRGQVNLSAGTHLIARMDGLQENPSLINSGKGIAAITLASVGSVGLAYDISVNGLSGPVTAAHFHFGKTGVNGPVVFDITSSFNGNNAKGVWRTGAGGLNDTMIAGLLTGKIYLNVHTSANPGGEIRGQVVLAAGFGANANLNGASENPPVVTPALGTAEMTFTDYGLVFSITVDGLSGPITAAHFHNADSGANGPVVFDITGNFVNNTASGRWKASTAAGDLTPTLIKELFANRLYVNVHTAANPSGEIRGQVKMKNGSGIGAFFTGAQEVPVPVVTTASGTAALYTISTGLQYFITVTGLSGPITGAHFHYGSIKEGGPVVKDITSTFTGNTANGTWLIAEGTPFNDSLRRALVNGKIYLNIHTAANPTGEVRGQVFLTAGTGMTSVLDGNQEVPSLSNTAKGTGSYTLTRGGLGFNIAVNGLSGPITAAHFHLGDVGVAGPVVFDIGSSVSGNNIVGYWRPVVTIDSLFNALLTGRIYVNVHTAANPGGEIRGQVIISEGFGLTDQITRTQEVPPTTTNARGTGSATGTDAGLVFFNTFDGLLSDSDLPPAAAHFHNAPLGINGPVVKDLMNNISGNNINGAWKRTDAVMPITNNFMSEAYLQNIYINIHSSEYPSGEIRGQLRSGALPIIPVQIISSLDVTPENSINTINTEHCVEGLVRDQSGVALSGLRVDYVIRGSNPSSGFAITDTAGIARFCYIGTVSGRDTIIATITDLADTVYKLWEVPLPVELASFSASVNKKDVTLNWTTSAEINNSGFEIERKLITATDWTKSGYVEGNGTTADPMSYSFTDRNLITGKYNYRLKQIDFNGNFEYFRLSSEIEVGIPVKFEISQNYPNPFNPTTKIDFQLPSDGNVKLSVYDNSGRLVASVINEFRAAGYYTVNFNAANLSSGIYFYKIDYNEISKVLKMSVIK